MWVAPVFFSPSRIPHSRCHPPHPYTTTYTESNLNTATKPYIGVVSDQIITRPPAQDPILDIGADTVRGGSMEPRRVGDGLYASTRCNIV